MRTPMLLRAEDMSGKTNRFAEEIQRSLDAVEEDVEVIGQQLKEAMKVTSATNFFSIDQNELMQSPSPAKVSGLDVEAKDLKKLAENYLLIQKLHGALEALSTAEAKLKSSFPEDGSAKGPLSSLASIRKKTNEKLKEAYQFLRDLADKKCPKEFAGFVEQTNRVVEKSIAYEKSESYLYLFEAEGVLAFAHYLRLMNAMDETGHPFKELYIVTSMLAVKSAPEFYVTTMLEFEPPSDRLLARRVDKINDFVRALHVMLAMDSFDNNLGALPVSLLVKPADIRPQLFNCAEHISAVTVDEDTGNLVFVLKPTVFMEDLRNKVIIQLQDEMKALSKATRSKMRVTPKFDPQANCWTLTFFMQKPEGAPQATADDVEFLKERFGLDTSKINRILHVVNSSLLYLRGQKPARLKANTQDVQPTEDDVEAMLEKAVILPSGKSIPGQEIVRVIDSAVAAASRSSCDPMPLIAKALSQMSVERAVMVEVCNKALAEARYYRRGLQAYVQELACNTKVVARKPSTKESASGWWDTLTKEQKEGYIEEHPDSKYARQARGEEETPAADKPAKAEDAEGKGWVKKDEKPDAKKEEPKDERNLDKEGRQIPKEVEPPKGNEPEEKRVKTKEAEDKKAEAPKDEEAKPEGKGWVQKTEAPKDAVDPVEGDPDAEAGQPKDGSKLPKSHMSHDEKKFFESGEHLPGSEARKGLTSFLKRKVKGTVHHVVETAKEWKTASNALVKIAKKQELDHHDREAIKAVAQELVYTTIALAVSGGMAAGAIAILHHAGSHILSNTLMSAAAKAIVHARVLAAKGIGDGQPDPKQMAEDALNDMLKQLQDQDFSDEEWENAFNSLKDVKELQDKRKAKKADKLQDKADKEAEKEKEDAAPEIASAVQTANLGFPAMRAYNLEGAYSEVFLDKPRAEAFVKHCVAVGNAVDTGTAGGKYYVAYRGKHIDRLAWTAERQTAGYEKADIKALQKQLEELIAKMRTERNPVAVNSIRNRMKAIKQMLHMEAHPELRHASSETATLTRADRTRMAREITEAMEESYKKHGEDGDFADGERYLRNDTSEQELRSEYKKWCKKDYVAASTEQARIKGDDEYVWLQYSGKPLNLTFRGNAVTLRPGDKYGVRWSSNKKDKRLVIDAPGFGLTKVFTLTEELEDKLRKTSVRASTGKGHDPSGKVVSFTGYTNKLQEEAIRNVGGRIAKFGPDTDILLYNEAEGPDCPDVMKALAAGKLVCLFKNLWLQ